MLLLRWPCPYFLIFGLDLLKDGGGRQKIPDEPSQKISKVQEGERVTASPPRGFDLGRWEEGEEVHEEGQPPDPETGR